MPEPVYHPAMRLSSTPHTEVQAQRYCSLAPSKSMMFKLGQVASGNTRPLPTGLAEAGVLTLARAGFRRNQR